MPAVTLITAHHILARSSILAGVPETLVNVLITKWACESQGAVAVEVIVGLGLTSGSVGTGVVFAWVGYLNLAVESSISWFALALKVIYFVYTDATIPARLSEAIVVVVLAVRSRVALSALTGVGAESLVTDSAVLARVRPTLVFLKLTP